MAEVSRFHRDYWGNGQLEITNAETGELISRKDAFVPVNWFLNFEAANAGIERWKELARQRRDRDHLFGEQFARLAAGYDIQGDVSFGTLLGIAAEG